MRPASSNRQSRTRGGRTRQRSRAVVCRGVSADSRPSRDCATPVARRPMHSTTSPSCACRRRRALSRACDPSARARRRPAMRSQRRGRLEAEDRIALQRCRATACTRASDSARHGASAVAVAGARTHAGAARDAVDGRDPAVAAVARPISCEQERRAAQVVARHDIGLRAHAERTDARHCAWRSTSLCAALWRDRTASDRRRHRRTPPSRSRPRSPGTRRRRRLARRAADARSRGIRSAIGPQRRPGQPKSAAASS